GSGRAGARRTRNVDPLPCPPPAAGNRCRRFALVARGWIVPLFSHRPTGSAASRVPSRPENDPRSLWLHDGPVLAADVAPAEVERRVVGDRELRRERLVEGDA